MISVSNRFKELVASQHIMKPFVDIYLWTAKGVKQNLATDIPIISGNVTADLSSTTMRTAEFVVPGYQWVPTSPQSPLAPFGQFAIIYYGLLVDGVWEKVKLGEFPIQTVTVERPLGSVSVTCGDWSSRVEEYAFENDYPYGPANTRKTYEEVMRLCDQAMPHKEVILTSGSVPASANTLVDKALSYQQGSGRWSAVLELSERVNCDVYFNNNGDLVMRQQHDFDIPQTAVWTLKSGQGGSIVSLSSTVTREGAANGVAIRLEDTDSSGKNHTGPKLGIARITTGPMAWGDTFGRIPFTNTLRAKIPTQSDANAKAKAALRPRAGVLRTLELTIVPQPFLEPGDCVNIHFPQSKTPERHLIQAVTIGLSPSEGMTIRTRQDVAKTVQAAAMDVGDSVELSGEWDSATYYPQDPDWQENLG